MHYNMVNEAMNLKKSITDIKVGMCGTMFCGTDRWPIVVTEAISKKKIRVVMMNDNDYHNNIKTDENGVDCLDPSIVEMNYVVQGTPLGKIYSYRRNMRWIQEGHDMWETGAIHIGKADEYRDPDF